ncbi:MAG: 4-hydroxy-tetrahydrodipicolinate reductase [Acidimicrobiia bacterium]|nr:4-hydroxy-tetrahydrodipicolinate reductase [Acidimicrobiia bacterium]
MIRVAISGAGGKLASAVIGAVSSADDLELTTLYNPSREGAEIEGREIAGSHDLVTADVVVEAAPPDAVETNLRLWRDLQVATVVGTSGFTSEKLDDLREMWGTASPCLVVPNFSIGAVLMMRFAAEAASHFEATEIIERHGPMKSDAPSGTALATAMGVGAAGGRSSDTMGELVSGARGGEVEGIRIHSLRMPGVISQQEVAMANTGEVLSISHVSTSYESFAGGAVAAIRGVRSLPGGIHVGLEAVL